MSNRVFSAVGLGFFVAATPGLSHIPAPDGTEYERVQYNLLEGYEDFIMRMTNEDGTNCCGTYDGRANLKEEILGHDKNGKPIYQVTLTHDLSGNEYDEPVTVVIPPEKILLRSHAREVCAEIREGDPDSSCFEPLFNVIWYNDLGNNAGKITEGGPITASVYCYMPKNEGF